MLGRNASGLESGSGSKGTSYSGGTGGGSADYIGGDFSNSPHHTSGSPGNSYRTVMEEVVIIMVLVIQIMEQGDY